MTLTLPARQPGTWDTLEGPALDLVVYDDEAKLRLVTGFLTTEERQAWWFGPYSNGVKQKPSTWLTDDLFAMVHDGRAWESGESGVEIWSRAVLLWWVGRAIWERDRNPLCRTWQEAFVETIPNNYFEVPQADEEDNA